MTRSAAPPKGVSDFHQEPAKAGIQVVFLNSRLRGNDARD